MSQGEFLSRVPGRLVGRRIPDRNGYWRVGDNGQPVFFEKLPLKYWFMWGGRDKWEALRLASCRKHLEIVDRQIKEAERLIDVTT